MATEQVHKEFQERLKRCLKDNGEIGELFSQTIKKVFPKSSKRGSRQQNRLKVARS
jgi:hypothetical protein